MLEKRQWHCGQRIAPANRSYHFAHNKTPDGNSKGRVEPEDGLSSLSGIVPMGRFSAGGVWLHELRQPKPANATFARVSHRRAIASR